MFSVVSAPAPGSMLASTPRQAGAPNRPSGVAPPAVALVPEPIGVRTFRGGRRVRFSDVDRGARVRLDALAGYLQDIAGDDVADAGVADDTGWLMRRNVFEVVRPPVLGEVVHLVTWASGEGARWAERRLTVRGCPASPPERGCPASPPERGCPASPPERRKAGSLVEGVSLWVSVDPATLRPARLGPAFVRIFGPASNGRTVSPRLQLPPAPPAGAEPHRRSWPLRATDIDPLQHVNNAAAWAMVVEALAEHPVPPPFRAEIEYRAPVEPGHEVVLDVLAAGAGLSLWAREARTGTLLVAAAVRPLAA
jgi:acyl-ACP thioesterase